MHLLFLIISSHLYTSSQQKIFELGRSASLPDSSWSKAVGEMLTRLPLGIIQLPRLFAGGDVQAAARCMKCCQIVCDVFVRNTMQLHSSPDFSAYWCKFSSILASNAGAVDRGSDLYAQSIIMINSLFQLLKPTPIFKSSARKTQHAGMCRPVHVTCEVFNNTMVITSSVN